MLLQRHVSNQLSHQQAVLELYEVYKVAVHIWDPKDLQQQVLV